MINVFEKLTETKRYQSQALALVLIIVLICALIALALISRTLKQNARVAEETLSSGAIEVSDSLIEISKSIDLEDIEDVCPTFETGGECCYDARDLSQFDGIDTGVIGDALNCPGETETTAQLCFKKTGTKDGYNMSKDETLTLNIASSVSSSPCNINFKFTPTLQTDSGVVLSHYEGSKDPVSGEITSMAENDPDDIIGLAIQKGANWGGKWLSYNPSTGYNLPVITNNPSSNTLFVRIKAIGSDMKINWDSSCVTFDPKVIVVASTNCGGTYRANYYYKDLKPSAPSLFDFVLYNGYGDLTFTE